MNKIKNNRIISFLIVIIVYVLATILGIVAFNLLPFELIINLFIADTIATIVVFIFSLIFKNASIYDPYWSVQPIVIIVGLLFKYELNLIKVLYLVVILLWGIRLTINWAYTFKNLHHEDWRYRMLREKTGRFYPIINFLGIHYFPTIVVFFVTLPAVFIIKSNVSINPFTIVFLTLSVFAIIIEAVADIQMHMYRKNRTTPFIRIGLWKHSRHPNYLGEILMWWGIGLATIFTLLDNYYLILGAVINTLLFTFVSIPMAEKRQSRKEGFTEYKMETRVILPIKKFGINR